MMNGNMMGSGMSKIKSISTKTKVFIGVIVAAVVGVGAVAFGGSNSEGNDGKIVCSRCGQVICDDSENKGAVGKVKGWFNDADNVVKGWFGEEGSNTAKAADKTTTDENTKGKNKNKQSEGKGWQNFYGDGNCDDWGNWGNWDSWGDCDNWGSWGQWDNSAGENMYGGFYGGMNNRGMSNDGFGCGRR